MPPKTNDDMLDRLLRQLVRKRVWPKPAVVRIRVRRPISSW
jgi:hypothetical protein